MDTLKCLSCGAVLKVDSDEKYIVCEYCDSTNVNPHAAPKNHIEELVQNQLNRAESFVKLNDYDAAYFIYKELADKYPNDYRGHWGIVISKTKNFSFLDISDINLSYVKSNYENAVTTAPKSKNTFFISAWNSYIQNIQAHKTEQNNKKIEEERKAQEECSILQRAELQRKTIRIVVRIVFALAFIIFNIFYFRYIIVDSDYRELSNGPASLILFYTLFILDIVFAVIGAIIFKSKIYAILTSVISLLANVLFCFFSSNASCDPSIFNSENCSDGISFSICFSIGYFAFWVGRNITRKLFEYINK